MYAGQHLRTVVRLLEPSDKVGIAETIFINDVLRPTAERLLSSFGGCTSDLLESVGQPGAPMDLPARFDHLNDAGNSLSMIAEVNFCKLGATVGGVSDESAVDVINAADRLLRQWWTVFQSSFNLFDAVSDHYFRREGLGLLIRQRTLQILIRTRLDYNEMGFDTQRSGFCDIVTLCRHFVLSDDQISSTSKSAPYRFYFGTAIIPSLTFTGMRCRDPFIRRQALRLLTERDRIEGYWGSDSSAKVIERIILLEERGLDHVKTAGDVPPASRIKVLRCSFYPGSVGMTEMYAHQAAQRGQAELATS